MARYTIKTTVDITRSNPGRDEPDQIKHAQQSNFNSLIQAIGLRTNINWYVDPEVIEEDGDRFWQWEFISEQPDVFLKDGNPISLLIEDLNGVPIIKNLTNTVDLPKAAFFAEGNNQNIWVETI